MSTLQETRSLLAELPTDFGTEVADLIIIRTQILHPRFSTHPNPNLFVTPSPPISLPLLSHPTPPNTTAKPNPSAYVIEPIVIISLTDADLGKKRRGSARGPSRRAHHRTAVVLHRRGSYLQPRVAELTPIRRFYAYTTARDLGLTTELE
ncbi:hypothetical protein PIB30_006085 [Stylosanthes scabra]|uniref:Uncharacterized protein n=1 Tax=Stylosanthes scabra TaxID=79078 RepID=A0ABU6V2K4_9FABA|nr:hypothetical protein [Stylosanthes scabra]